MRTLFLSAVFPLLLILCPANVFATDGYVNKKIEELRPYIKQFDGMKINGLTAHETMMSAIEPQVAKAVSELTQRQQYIKNQQEKLNSVIQNENNLRHIFSREAVNYHLPIPNQYDYFKSGGEYLHRFIYNGYVYGCSHYSFNELERHADLLQYVNDSRMSLMQEETKLLDKSDEIFIYNYIEPYVNSSLEPFKNQKISDIEDIISSINPLIKEISCTKVVFNGYVRNCNSVIRCRLEPSFDKNKQIGISCICGHDINIHKIKSNKKDFVLNKIREYQKLP